MSEQALKERNNKREEAPTDACDVEDCFCKEPGYGYSSMLNLDEPMNSSTALNTATASGVETPAEATVDNSNSKVSAGFIFDTTLEHC